MKSPAPPGVLVGVTHSGLSGSAPAGSPLWPAADRASRKHGSHGRGARGGPPSIPLPQGAPPQYAEAAQGTAAGCHVLASTWQHGGALFLKGAAPIK